VIGESSFAVSRLSTLRTRLLVNWRYANHSLCFA
jgi:hypothetical protein